MYILLICKKEYEEGELAGQKRRDTDERIIDKESKIKKERRIEGAVVVDAKRPYHKNVEVQ